MEAYRRFPKSAAARPAEIVASSASGRIQASDALPLPIRHTNLLFSALFAFSLIFLMRRWCEKIHLSMPLHVVGLAEIFTIVGLVASLIYLLSFFGIAFVQSIVSSHDEEDDFLLSPAPPAAAVAAPPTVLPTLAPCPLLCDASPAPDKMLAVIEEDEDIISSIVAGKTPSYILESKLGYCRCTTEIHCCSTEGSTTCPWRPPRVASWQAPTGGARPLRYPAAQRAWF